MGPYAPRGTDKHFDKKDFFDTIKAWHFWAFSLGYFFMTNSLNAFGFFAPTIISTLGFTGCKSTRGIIGKERTISQRDDADNHRQGTTPHCPAQCICLFRHHWQRMVV